VPTDDEPQAQGVTIDLPRYPKFDPVPFRQLGVDGLEPLVAQRWQALAVFAKRLHHLRIDPRCRADEKAAILSVHTTQIVQIDIATIR
jgi:hypothetical protein